MVEKQQFVKAFGKKNFFSPGFYKPVYYDMKSAWREYHLFIDT